MDFLTVLFFVLSLISSLLTGGLPGRRCCAGAEEGRAPRADTGPGRSACVRLCRAAGSQWMEPSARARTEAAPAAAFSTCHGRRDLRRALCGNLSANLLGLGNAATPLGVQAVQQMKLRSGGDAASDEMCMLIVMNTASMQLLPTTVASVRAGLGAAKPFEILVPVWLASVCSVGAGIFAAKVLRRFL